MRVFATMLIHTTYRQRPLCAQFKIDAFLSWVFLKALKLDALIEIKLHVFSLFPIGLTFIEGFLKKEWYLEALI